MARGTWRVETNGNNTQRDLYSARNGLSSRTIPILHFKITVVKHRDI